MSGVEFRFETGSRGRHDLVEIMGGGVALIDADGNGLPDIYACNGGPIVPGVPAAATPCRLFMNEGNWKFRDATATCGAPGPDYAMGAAVGDYDNDGRDDLFVTGWRDQRLYRNLGGGRFEDVTTRAGVTSTLWSTSAAFADLDLDGDLDLYVSNYLAFDPKQAPFCAAPDGMRDFCGPELFPAEPDTLFRNNGDGTFTRIDQSAGIKDSDGRGLGVLIADFDSDGRLDVFVANDGTAHFCWRNLGNLRFENRAREWGLALDADGHAMAGMGVAWGDLTHDGRSDLVVSNYWNRSTVGFQNLGFGHFQAQTDALGLSATRDGLGFGLVLRDLNADGSLDLVQANGHVLDRQRLGVPFAMRPTILRGTRARFTDASPSAGPFFGRPTLGRGLAIGDLDRDGRADLVFASLDQPLALLRNETEVAASQVRLAAEFPSHPMATGALLRVLDANGIHDFEVASGGSYLSASETAFTVRPPVKSIDVLWPSGRQERWENLPNTPTIRLEEGSGLGWFGSLTPDRATARRTQADRAGASGRGR